MTGDAPEPALRVDWLDADGTGRGRLGITFLPGKTGPSMRYPGRVYRRSLDADLRTLAQLGIGHLLLLVEDEELVRWGDPAIVEIARRGGLVVDRAPIRDGTPPTSPAAMDAMLDRLNAARRQGHVAVACLGGVGRAGTIAACALVADGWTASEAIGEVRRVRHPTAVETPDQVAFVEAYERHVREESASD